MILFNTGALGTKYASKPFIQESFSALFLQNPSKSMLKKREFSGSITGFFVSFVCSQKGIQGQALLFIL